MTENIPRKVITTRIVKQWITNLADQVGKAAINDRIDLIKQGNFDDIENPAEVRQRRRQNKIEKEVSHEQEAWGQC